MDFLKKTWKQIPRVAYVSSFYACRMEQCESLQESSTSQAREVIGNGIEKQLRDSSCSSSQSASSSSHGTVWGSHIQLRISHGPRPPRHLTSSKVQLSLTVCARAQLSSSGEFCSGEDSLPQLRPGPSHVLRWLRRSLISRRPARRHCRPAFPGSLAQQSGRWSPLPR